jgi:hypothetical protein
VLYLQSIPMTEMLFLASLAGTLYFSLTGHAAAAGLCVLAGTMTRYEAWILVPVVAAYLAFRLKRLVPVLLFIAIASSGAAWWLAHNLYYYGDPLEFYRGEWSAKAIYQRALDQGMARYPGDHDVGKAWMYYRSAAGAVAGIALVILGGLGIAVSLARRVVWPAVLLSVPVGFYVLSMYSSGTPIFVPHLWPHSYYNTRYGLAAIPLFAFGVSALAIRPWLAVALVAASMLPWVIYTEPSYWITWSESKVNSEARRAWTAEAAKFLKANYRDGDGVLASFGDLTAVFPEAGIPLKQVLHDGNGPYWLAAIARPDLFAKEKWALALSGDLVSDAIQKSRTEVYTRIHTINVSGAAPVTIYRHR